MAKEFDEVYAGYVIKDEDSRMFVGWSSQEWRVVLREHAARFTKADAMKYIQKSEGNFKIEDAT